MFKVRLENIIKSREDRSFFFSLSDLNVNCVSNEKWFILLMWNNRGEKPALIFDGKQQNNIHCVFLRFRCTLIFTRDNNVVTFYWLKTKKKKKLSVIDIVIASVLSLNFTQVRTRDKQKRTQKLNTLDEIFFWF